KTNWQRVLNNGKSVLLGSLSSSVLPQLSVFVHFDCEEGRSFFNSSLSL
ncbi:hypothetical protein VII00023_03848, partial [Vibrio ichthyoenteri ATCC 700023]